MVWQMPNPAFQETVSIIEQFKETAANLLTFQELSVNLIGERLPYYNWVGFYKLDSKDPGMLALACASLFGEFIQNKRAA